jgi:hypothetical protein
MPEPKRLPNAPVRAMPEVPRPDCGRCLIDQTGPAGIRRPHFRGGAMRWQPGDPIARFGPGGDHADA